ncbi:hypothetical protein V6N11_077423 [Hibiscus sabdariffa]|uniref:Secreted protein n=1 Tax=Hibiscus sabdariffa TaxID=183260 RepID=A0ABR2TD25_9ROSI
MQHWSWTLGAGGAAVAAPRGCGWAAAAGPRGCGWAAAAAPRGCGWTGAWCSDRCGNWQLVVIGGAVGSAAIFMRETLGSVVIVIG